MTFRLPRVVLAAVSCLLASACTLDPQPELPGVNPQPELPGISDGRDSMDVSVPTSSGGGAASAVTGAAATGTTTGSATVTGATAGAPTGAPTGSPVFEPGNMAAGGSGTVGGVGTGGASASGGQTTVIEGAAGMGAGAPPCTCDGGECLAPDGGMPPCFLR